jgi:hypothetical protein
MKTKTATKREKYIFLVQQGMRLDRELTAALALRQENVVQNLYALIEQNNKAMAELKRSSSRKQR